MKKAGSLFQKVLGTEGQSFEIDLKIDPNSAKNPGAFAKWKKVKKHGVITITQTLLDLELLSEGALLVILCHELGHFYGGAPFVTVKSSGNTIFTFSNPFELMSVEGQADFYATNICLPEVIEATFPDQTDEWYYGESLKWVKEVTQVYDHINHEYFGINQEWSTDERDPSVIDTINLNPGSYPSLQCRLDTMVSGLGAIVNETSERPRCWFKD